MSLPWAPDAGNIFLAVAPLTAIAAVVQFVGNIMRLNMLLVLADNPGMTIVRDQRDDVTITITACCSQSTGLLHERTSALRPLFIDFAA